MTTSIEGSLLYRSWRDAAGRPPSTTRFFMLDVFVALFQVQIFLALSSFAHARSLLAWVLRPSTELLMVSGRYIFPGACIRTRHLNLVFRIPNFKFSVFCVYFRLRSNKSLFSITSGPPRLASSDRAERYSLTTYNSVP